MRVVRLASETDFEGWREAARALRTGGVSPADVVWTVDDGARGRSVRRFRKP